MSLQASLAAARDLIGTPYHLGYSKPKIGCDCIGVIEHCWRVVRGSPAPMRPPIVGDYYDDPSDLLLTGARANLTEIESALPGCVLVFRIKNKPGCSHIGICSEAKNGTAFRFIHAHDGRKVRRVVETTLGPRWLPNLAGVFVI